MLGWVTVTGDADYGLYPLLHSSSFGGLEIEHFITIQKWMNYYQKLEYL